MFCSRSITLSPVTFFRDNQSWQQECARVRECPCTLSPPVFLGRLFVVRSDLRIHPGNDCVALRARSSYPQHGSDPVVGDAAKKG